jgi:hypothetical protein
MDAKELRERSKEQAQSLGYPFNPNLPLLDPAVVTRSSDEVLDRILILNACIACGYGFPKPKALDWLKQEHLSDCLTDPEAEFLAGKAEAKRTAFQWRVEALWALAWAAGYFDSLDFGQSCSDDLVKMLPNLNTHASSEAFREKSKLRSAEEVLPMVDLAYSLHWAVREEGLRGQVYKPGKVQSQVIVERRLGLEWLICDESWEDVLLDT